MNKCIESDGIRIDPAQHGVHLVDVKNGGERVYIPHDRIDYVIELLKVVRDKK